MEGEVRQTDRQTDRQTVRQRQRERDSETHRQADRQTERHRWIDGWMDRRPDRQTDRQSCPDLESNPQTLNPESRPHHAISLDPSYVYAILPNGKAIFANA